MKMEVDVNIADIACQVPTHEAAALIKNIDLAIADVEFSTEILKWLFESLQHDVSKKELLEFLETGSEAAITEW